MMEANLDFGLPPEIKQKYISRRYVDLTECFSALDNNDYNKIAYLAHQMKGNGTSFGYSKITELGNVLEIAAKNEDSSSIKTYLQELNYFLDLSKTDS